MDFDIYNSTLGVNFRILLLCVSKLIDFDVYPSVMLFERFYFVFLHILSCCTAKNNYSLIKKKRSQITVNFLGFLMAEWKDKWWVISESWGDADTSRCARPALRRLCSAETLIDCQMQPDCCCLVLFQLRAGAAVQREIAVHIQMDPESHSVFPPLLNNYEQSLTFLNRSKLYI